MRIILSAFLLLLQSAVEAQSASYSYIDQKKPFKNPSPALLTALTKPKLGTAYKVRVPATWWNGSYNRFASYSLAFGVRNPDVAIPGLGGWLFTSADVVLRGPWGRPGTMVEMSFAVPNSSQWLGVRFYQQVYEVSYLASVSQTVVCPEVSPG